MEMTLTATLPRSFTTTAGLNTDPLPVSMPSELTVAQAANHLRMSENHLSDLLDAGRISFRMKNGERLIPVDHLLEYEQERERRHAVLDEMVRENQEMGLYDV